MTTILFLLKLLHSFIVIKGYITALLFRFCSKINFGTVSHLYLSCIIYFNVKRLRCLEKYLFRLKMSEITD